MDVRSGVSVSAPFVWRCLSGRAVIPVSTLPSSNRTGATLLNTRLQRYYEPLRHPKAPSLSLAGFRLVIADHAIGLPVLRTLSLCTCCRHYPGAAAGRILRSAHPAVSAFPEREPGRVERGRLVCCSLNYGDERRSRAFLVRWLSGARNEHRLSH